MKLSNIYDRKVFTIFAYISALATFKKLITMIVSKDNALIYYIILF